MKIEEKIFNLCYILGTEVKSYKKTGNNITLINIKNILKMLNTDEIVSSNFYDYVLTIAQELGVITNDIEIMNFIDDITYSNYNGKLSLSIR